MTATGQEGSFKGRHFTSEVILWALRWYPAFPISDRDLAAMLSDRGVAVEHTTLFRRVQTYAAKLEHMNNIIEQDHRRIKRLARPGRGFGSLQTARRRQAGYEAMAMIRKGQVHGLGGRDMPAQAAFIHRPPS